MTHMTFPSPGASGDQAPRRARHLAATQTAAAYLAARVYRILDRDWLCSTGSLDVVAADRAELVVAVVKTGTRAGYGGPLAPAGHATAGRLRTLALRWMGEHGSRYGQIRIDVVGVLFEGTGGYTIEHVKAVG